MLNALAPIGNITAYRATPDSFRSNETIARFDIAVGPRTGTQRWNAIADALASARSTTQGAIPGVVVVRAGSGFELHELLGRNAGGASPWRPLELESIRRDGMWLTSARGVDAGVVAVVDGELLGSITASPYQPSSM